MKKFIGILISIILISISLLGFSGCDPFATNEKGDFLYRETLTETLLFGLSENGQKKDTIIVPEKIVGSDIVHYTFDYNGKIKGNFESENLRQMYIQPYVAVYGMDLSYTPNLEKIVFCGGWGNENDFIRAKDNQIGVKIFIPKFPGVGFVGDEGVQDVMDECGRLDGKLGGEINTYVANVTFAYNYSGATNHGIYWADNFNYGEKIAFIPKDPQGWRDEIFCGWYKEPECLNKWDFETDTLPKPEFNEDGDELYQETRLYAKWKNNIKGV